jgi:hypothetical protein
MDVVVWVSVRRATKHNPTKMPAIVVEASGEQTYHDRIQFNGRAELVQEEVEQPGASITLHCDHTTIVELNPPRAFVECVTSQRTS